MKPSLALAHLAPFLRCSNDASERLGGIIAIEELSGSKLYSTSPARLSDLVKMLMEVFQLSSDQNTMEVAAKALGQTVKAGGALMAGVVEEQVRRGVGGLGGRDGAVGGGKGEFQGRWRRRWEAGAVQPRAPEPGFDGPCRPRVAPCVCAEPRPYPPAPPNPCRRR